MSSSNPDKANGSSTRSNPRNTLEQLSSARRDLSSLTTILSETNIDGDPEDLSESNLTALFQQIDGANGVLDGVEGKLNGLLNDLDKLLAALEDSGDQDDKGEERKGVEESATTSTNASADRDPVSNTVQDSGEGGNLAR